jgi:hypothetical protein
VRGLAPDRALAERSFLSSEQRQQLSSWEAIERGALSFSSSEGRDAMQCADSRQGNIYTCLLHVKDAVDR